MQLLITNVNLKLCMEIISNFKNWLSRHLDLTIPLLLLLIWATLLTFGTISIFYEKNSESQSISIRLTELRQLINTLEEQNVHSTCRVVLLTSDLKTSKTLNNFGTLYVLMKTNTDVSTKKLSTQHLSILPYEPTRTTYFPQSSKFGRSYTSFPRTQRFLSRSILYLYGFASMGTIRYSCSKDNL